MEAAARSGMPYTAQMVYELPQINLSRSMAVGVARTVLPMNSNKPLPRATRRPIRSQIRLPQGTLASEKPNLKGIHSSECTRQRAL